MTDLQLRQMVAHSGIPRDAMDTLPDLKSNHTHIQKVGKLGGTKRLLSTNLTTSHQQDRRNGKIGSSVLWKE